MSKLITHEELENFAIKILLKLGVKDLKKNNREIGVRNNDKTYIPDLINKDICVEIGTLCCPNNINDRKERLKSLLLKYKQVYWFPYPETTYGVPLFKIILFEKFEDNIIKDLQSNLLRVRKENNEIRLAQKNYLSGILNKVKLLFETELNHL
jgi:hypothetical protein